MNIIDSIRLPLAAALGLTLAGSALAAGVTIDQAPLVVARPLPPNIMFIMDDSGSMAWQHMPGTTATWRNSPDSGLPHTSMNNDIRLRASNINTQWYNPATTYLPWKNWDGTFWQTYNPMTESVPYDPSGEVETGTWNLRRGDYPDEPDNTDRDSNSRTGSTDRAFRFQGFYVHQGDSQTSNNNYKRFDFRWNSNRWEGRYCDRSRWGNGTNYGDCTYYVGNNAMGPFGRTMAEEVQNYANWFSYHRLRASMAKAAASQVFADLGEDYRVGYNTIWNRQNYTIPVETDNGLFRGTNKQGWFTRLFDTGASSGTPLREALGRAGEYFSETGADGPYGPESGSNQFSCRQNFAILTTDGYWNSNQAGNSSARANNDGNDGATITGPNGASYQYIAGNPYSDNRSGTLADVAMYYWKTDLRAGNNGLKNDVPTSAGNPAFWQHMTTFGISIGLQGSLDPTSDLPGLISGSTSWPNPNDSEDNHRIDDLWHAAVNSRGEFIVASDADSFTESLGDALGAIADRLGSGASLAANSTKLDTGTRTFQAQYWSGAWRGELNAFSVNPDGSLSAAPLWRASQHIPAHGSRSIWTNINSGNFNNRFQSFQLSNLSNAQKAELGNSTDLVAYLRGDQSKEESQPGGTFRTRTSVMGDIVNSQPVFVGAPNPRLYSSATFTGGPAYGAFVSTQAGRTPALYVGANDGMLHALNANTGAELFAFVPNAAIMKGLGELANPNYEHQYFVDGEITVADVYGGSPARWRTVLVGTMGRGGRAIFALDVTNPSNPDLLWEVDVSNEAAIGNTLGKPIIAQVGNGDWKVLIGNGANSAGDTAQLLMIDVFRPNNAPPAIDTITTGVSGNNGLTAVYTWDSNQDGFTDTAYAGDLRGNLWRFNLGASPPSAQLLFSAGTGKPITAAPIAATDPGTGLRWVFFGTGQYLNAEDLTNTDTQTWYGIIDRGTTVTQATLVERSITAEGEINGFGARVIDTGSATDLVGKNGWYMNFVSPVNGAEGERMVTPNQLRGPVLVGTTRIPDASDPCSPSGRGFVMAINPFTGARLSQTFFDITRDGDFTTADMLNGQIVSGIGFTASPNNPIFIEDVMQVSLDDGSTRTLGTQGTPATAVRQSWRELLGE